MFVGWWKKWMMGEFTVYYYLLCHLFIHSCPITWPSQQVKSRQEMTLLNKLKICKNKFLMQSWHVGFVWQIYFVCIVCLPPRDSNQEDNDFVELFSSPAIHHLIYASQDPQALCTENSNNTKIICCEWAFVFCILCGQRD